MTARVPAIAVVALAWSLVAGVGCGDDEDSRSSAQRPSPLADDRGPGAETAAATPSPEGVYEDPMPDGTVAAQAEEAVRDYQESLAEGSGGGACSEMRDSLQRLVGGGGSCAAAVQRAIDERRSNGEPAYRPSKILAVRVRGADAAEVAVQDGEREPFSVLLDLEPDFSWKLTDVDLGDPSGLRPASAAHL